MTGRVTRSFTVAMHVLLSALKRWKSVSECVCGLDKHRGKLHMHLSPSVCVCVCVSESAWAVSLIPHAHREWRMTGEYTAGGGHVMLIAIFTPEFFIFLKLGKIKPGRENDK